MTDVVEFGRAEWLFARMFERTSRPLVFTEAHRLAERPGNGTRIYGRRDLRKSDGAQRRLQEIQEKRTDRR